MQNQNEVAAVPTKEFFIDMLVRDVRLIDAIVDLVDNSVDAANRLAKGGSLTGYEIRISLSGKEFLIEDNCGGMTVNAARHYAFCFGRHHNDPELRELDVDGATAIGQFGVGMKRTIFKLGRFFKVSSVTTSSRFTIEQDVDEWLADHNTNWHFKFSEVEENRPQTGPFGTTLRVTRLNKVAAEELQTENFGIALAEKVKSAVPGALAAGLSLFINGTRISANVAELLSSRDIQPSSKNVTIRVPGKGTVELRLIAGILKPPGDTVERGLRDGGWYIFCNNRQIVAADQSALTGWGTRSMVQYHPDYAFFRGYAFFSSDVGSILPWTTTKNGVDSDSPVFRQGMLEATDVMRPVIDFLKSLAKERTLKNRDEIEETPLLTALATATARPLTEIPAEAAFKSPDPKFSAPAERTITRIQYDANLKDYENVRRKLRAKSKTEVGLKTFQYYVDMECE